MNNMITLAKFGHAQYFELFSARSKNKNPARKVASIITILTARISRIRSTEVG